MSSPTNFATLLHNGNDARTWPRYDTVRPASRIVALVLAALFCCACSHGARAVAPASVIAPTILVMTGVRAENRGDHAKAIVIYRDALDFARRAYDNDHPNVAFAHAALGVWHARFGAVEDARRHLRESWRIDEARGGLFANLADTRLPASGSEDLTRVVMRLRLQRDLLLCMIDGGCSPSRVLGLSEALGEVGR